MATNTEQFTAGRPADIGAPSTPETLSVEALELYRAALETHAAFTVTKADHIDVVDEIVAANLGRCHWYGGDYKPDVGSLNVIRLHPLYFVADGSGPLTIQIHTGTHRNSNRALIAHLAGADLTCSNSDNPLEHRLVSRHRTVTDGEHDSTILTDATVDLVTFAGAGSVGVELRCVLTELRAWPLGAPLTDPGEDIVECDYCANRADTNSHHIGAYMPPGRRDLNGLCGQPISLAIITNPT